MGPFPRRGRARLPPPYAQNTRWIAYPQRAVQSEAAAWPQYQATLFDATILLTIGPLVIYAIGTAIIMPAITMLALDCFPYHRGTATSTQGFFQILINAGVAGIAVPVLHTQRQHFVIGQALFLSLAGALWYAPWRRRETG